jgi:hypothetical protein
MAIGENFDRIRIDQRLFNRVFLDIVTRHIDSRWDSREDCCKELNYKPHELSRYISGDFKSYNEFLGFLMDIGLTLYVADPKKNVAKFPGQVLGVR